MRRTLALSAAALGLAVLAAPSVRADLIALDFTGGAPTVINPLPATVGWSFSTNATLIVSQLGYWDATPATPLDSPHQVGIWTAAGALLGSSVVQTNSPITDEFRYAATFPFQLNAGQTYVIGAYIPAGTNSDNLFISSLAPLVTTTAPEITYGGNRFFGGGAALSFPDTSFGGLTGFYGPNFQFTAVPAPPAVVLAGIGLAGVAVRRFVRRGPNQELAV